MLRVYKYPFPLDGSLRLTMPRGARPLHVALQPGVGPCLWALVDPEAPPEVVTLVVTGTGHPVPPGHDYLGTFMDGPYVWHVWTPAPGG